MTPDALDFLLLGLAAFRLTRLAGWDDLTITPRRWLTGLGDDDHHAWASAIDELRQDGKDPWMPPMDTSASWSAPPVSRARFYVGKMIRCPWCAGWWVSLAVWLGWLAWPHAITSASIPLALSAVVGLVAKNLDE